MGLVTTKSVFAVSDKVRFQPVYSVTQTSKILKISLVASLDMILSNKQITKALISLCECAGWYGPLLFANPRRQVFSRGGPYVLMKKVWFLISWPYQKQADLDLHFLKSIEFCKKKLLS